jgi:hypothetical protein
MRGFLPPGHNLQERPQTDLGSMIFQCHAKSGNCRFVVRDFNAGSHNVFAIDDCLFSVHLSKLNLYSSLSPSSSSACFQFSSSLSLLAFERGSILAAIGLLALYGCSSLKPICLPALWRMTDALALTRTNILQVALDDGNYHFRVSKGFFADFDVSH